MKKNILTKGIALSICAVLIIAVCPVQAAEIDETDDNIICAVDKGESHGTIETAVEAEFGKSYTASWTKDTYRTNHYIKIEVPQRGIVNIKTTKPEVDGKYAKLDVNCYDTNGGLVWSTGSWTSVDDALNYYSWGIGLEKGTYYLTLKPDFYITSGTVSSTYTINYEDKQYTELEPDESVAEATVMDLGYMYKGYANSDGGYDGEKYDYYKVYLESGNKYRLYFGNYAKLDYSFRLSLKDPNGEDVYNGYSKVTSDIAKYVDSTGNNYVDFPIDTTGNYMLCVESDTFGKQFDYTMGVYKFNSAGNLIVPLEAGPAGSMYRLYNPNSGEHFYTANIGEGNSLIEGGWSGEGIAWTAPTSSNTPVYRLYSSGTGDHHYTTNAAEKDMLVNVGWKYEGVGWYSADSGTPVYRVFNPFATGAGSHHYTTSAAERDQLVAAGWKNEGVGWYGQ